MHDLGARLSRHTGSLWSGAMTLYVGGIFLLAGGFWVVNGLRALIAGADGAGTSLLIGLVGAGIGGAVLLMKIMRWRQVVEIYERGLVHTRLFFGSETIRADEVTGIKHTIRRSRSGTTHELDIELGGNQLYTITGLAEPEQVLSFIRSWTRGGAPPQGHAQPQQGWQPPAQGGHPQQGWQPPQQGGHPQQGWQPPQQGGHPSHPAQPAPQQGPHQGYAPQQGWQPPQQGGWTPPDQGNR